MTNTPARSIRVSDKIWKLAKNKAKKEGTTISTIVILAILKWLDE